LEYTLNQVEGYLEILDKGFGFLRSIENNFQPGPGDPFVPAPVIQQFELPEGAFVIGGGKPSDGANTNLKMAEVVSINGLSVDDFAMIAPIQDQISINPEERFRMAVSPEDITGTALDMIVPVGKGQRGLIIAPPKSGKTTILKHMANAITRNHPDTMVIVLLVDERPEEVTDFKRGLENAHVLYSSADQKISQHMRITRMAINSAMRYAESGHDAVVFIDSLTRLSRAFNTKTQSHGRVMTGGLGANAMAIPRQIFGTARNIENGGSLTMIATILVDTGSRMDDIIFQEFKGTGNMDLMLSQKCAEQRLWPAIHINKSGTRKEELLLDKQEYNRIIEIRRALSKMDEVSATSYLLEHIADH
jgi:transcription termination factor Rho